MKDVKVIELIRSGETEKAFTRLYTYYGKAEKHICANSGSKEEALDIFQEALVVLYRKVSADKPDSAFSCEGYLINTCKFLWSNELRKKAVRIGDDKGLGKIVYEDDIQTQLEKESQFRQMEKVLSKLGEKCRTILEQFYFHALSMERIAQKFGFKTVESAKVQKYKCIETARKLALEAHSFNSEKQSV